RAAAPPPPRALTLPPRRPEPLPAPCPPRSPARLLLPVVGVVVVFLMLATAASHGSEIAPGPFWLLSALLLLAVSALIVFRRSRPSPPRPPRRGLGAGFFVLLWASPLLFFVLAAVWGARFAPILPLVLILLLLLIAGVGSQRRRRAAGTSHPVRAPRPAPRRDGRGPAIGWFILPAGLLVVLVLFFFSVSSTPVMAPPRSTSTVMPDPPTPFGRTEAV